MSDKKRNKFISFYKGEITIHSIRRLGASFNKPENVVVKKWKLVCVGNKRPTTHLPAGLLFQFFPILPK